MKKTTKPLTDNPILDRALAAFIFIACLALLYVAPDHWRFTPDSGIYVGSAVELVENHRYWFNHHPNLLYFPGTSAVLVPVIFIFGVNFFLLHLLFAAVASLTLFFCYRYYSMERYGLVGLLLPVMLLANKLFQASAFKILSDGIMLAIVIAAFLAWHNYLKKSNTRYLFIAAALASYAPMVRFEGVFLTTALVLAYLIVEWRSARPFQAIFKSAALGAIIITPFLFWCWRDYILYTPDTYNAIGFRFFGQATRPLYAPGSLSPKWIDAEWKIPLYNILSFFDGLLDSVISRRVGKKVPPLLGVSVLLGLASLGIKPWLKRAHALEIGFTVMMVVFLVVWQFNNNTVVPRYWTPIVPVILVIVLGGCLQLYRGIRLPRIRLVARMAGLALGALILAHGAASMRYYLKSDERYAAGLRAMQGAIAFVEANTKAEEIIAVTDWGTMPHLTKRRATVAMNDASHQYTLQRLARDGAVYLVLVDGLARRASVQANRMVLAYPSVFEPVFQQKTPSALFSTTVYRINPYRLQKVVANATRP